MNAAASRSRSASVALLGEVAARSAGGCRRSHHSAAIGQRPAGSTRGQPAASARGTRRAATAGSTRRPAAGNIPSALASRSAPRRAAAGTGRRLSAFACASALRLRSRSERTSSRIGAASRPPPRPGEQRRRPRRHAAPVRRSGATTPRNIPPRALAEARQGVDAPALDGQRRQQDRPTRRQPGSRSRRRERGRFQISPAASDRRQQDHRLVQRGPQPQRPRHAAHDAPAPRGPPPQRPFRRQRERHARHNERLVVRPPERETVREDRAGRQHEQRARLAGSRSRSAHDHTPPTISSPSSGDTHAPARSQRPRLARRRTSQHRAQCIHGVVEGHRRVRAGCRRDNFQKRAAG